jgi:hypothetical protein
MADPSATKTLGKRVGRGLLMAGVFGGIVLFVILTMKRVGSTAMVSSASRSNQQSNTALSSTALSSRMSSAVQLASAGREGDVAVAVFDANSGQLWSSSSEQFDTASVVKVAILDALLRSREQIGTPLTTKQEGLADEMITVSDNDSATELWDEMGSTTGMQKYLDQFSATSTTVGAADNWGLTQTTASDQVELMKLIAYSNSTLDNQSRAYANELLDNVTADQRWGVSAGVAQDATVELKDGWLQRTTGWDINSVGHVTGDGRDYVIAVLTNNDPSEDYGIDTVQSVSTAVWNSLGN